jgi:hypothetical protein
MWPFPFTLQPVEAGASETGFRGGVVHAVAVWPKSAGDDTMQVQPLANSRITMQIGATSRMPDPRAGHRVCAVSRACRQVSAGGAARTPAGVSKKGLTPCRRALTL